MRCIDADVLNRKAQRVATEAWKMKITGKVETILNQFIDWINNAPTIEPEPQWIPCSERLPKEDVEVLISYRYKEGEGDTSHTDIDITTYGQMYFGGNKVGNYKHWRAPFEYFESNYEVIAWMPLPEPYKENEYEEKNNKTN